MQTKPVLKIDGYGNKRWYLNNMLHRTDGPAVEYSNGSKFWYLYGLLHKTDGPAIEWTNRANEWYLNHRYYTFEEWLELTPLSDKEKVKLRLEYAK